jgi:hypothetical protein
LPIQTIKTSLKIPNLNDDDGGDDDDDDHHHHLQDTNFYAELVTDKWDILISEYDIGGSFRIFRKGHIFQLTG